MNGDDPHFRPLAEMPGLAESGRDDTRPLRPRLSREPRMVRWAGCHFISAEEVPEVPEGAQLRLRFGLVHEGEELPFERKPFPLSATPHDLHSRYGPWRYVVDLCWIDTSAPGGNAIRKVLYSKHYEIRSRGEMDVGREPWPINLSSPEIPRSLLDEIERRAAIRGDSDPSHSTGSSAYGYADDYRARRGYGYAQRDNGYAQRDNGYSDAGYGDDGDDDPRMESPPHGFEWTRYRGNWVLVKSDGQDKFEDPLGLSKPQQPQQPPSLIGSLLSRPPEEVIALAAGVMKLFRDAGGGGSQAELERERIRAEYEVRKQEMAQQHQLFLKQMELQTQAAAAAVKPAAAPVDPNQIRAQALAEARLESMQREQQRLMDELRNARTSRQDAPDLLQQFSRLKQQAEALGLTAKSASGATPETPPPTWTDQVADFLDTQGGKVLVERLAEKFLGGAPPPAEAPPQPQQLPQPQLPIEHQGYSMHQDHGYAVAAPDMATEPEFDGPQGN